MPRRMRCVVFGGTGFIGSHVVDALLRAGHTVCAVGLAPNPYHSESPGCRYLYGDWREAGLLDRALAEPVDCAYHLIGTVDVEQANTDPADDMQETVLGSLQLLQACVRHAVRRVVFISSGGAVYGIPQGVPITEQHPTQPISAHGISKLAVEQYLQLFHRLHGVEYQIARCANPYGEWQDPSRRQGAVAVFLAKTLAGEPITVWGDGSAVRDYLYIGDVAQALLRLGEFPGPPGVFNIGSGQGVSVNDLLRAVAEVTGRTPAIEHRPARPYDVPANVLDITCMTSQVGWRPRVTLRQGLQRTAKWLANLQATMVP